MAQVNLTEMGKVGLTGWRAKIGQRIATPVAERTRLTEDQVKAILGGIFLALSVWQFLKLVLRVIEAGRTGQAPA
ncbi:MAG TPA: hypothetical protein VKA30_08240 [Actinomycetota bacterium]|nr:hypothetical protein [Actinomycetota bacterium]